MFDGIKSFIRPLLCDNGGGMSLGRIAFWIVLAPAIKIWWECDKDIAINHLYVLGFLLIYNSYKKIPMFIDLIHAWKGSDNTGDKDRG